MTDAQDVEFDVTGEAMPPISPPNGRASTSVAILETPKAVPSPATPMAMISLAIERGANMDVIEKMMGLQERWEANEARKAFDEAIAAAKAEIPPIIKGRTVDYGEGAKRTTYKHEDLAGIAKIVDPILSMHGLSYRYRVTSDLNQPIRVTCIIAHRLGHSEETTLTAGADSSGSKNSIQAIGSTITYLQRYTLKAALGLAAAADDDGKTADAAPATKISAEQQAELMLLADKAGSDVERLCAYLTQATKTTVDRLADLDAAYFEKAKTVLQAKIAGGAK